MLARRLLILLAVLVGLTALASGVAPREPAPSTSPQATPSPQGTAVAEPVEEIVDAGSPEPARVVVDEGALFVLEVRSDTVDSVSLDGLDVIAPVERESPARFEMLAEFPGTYPITLLQTGREVGTLEIREGG